MGCTLEAALIQEKYRRQVSKEEKAEWINGLAALYQKQGLQSACVLSTGGYANEIKQKIVEVTGLDSSTVNG